MTSKYEIGAFYFPGFPTTSQWQPIRGYPNRKPILGWYDESNPECADWQIKWAVEHGINFFMVDWYWCQGNRQLEHWLHNAYGKARYKKYLKWAVMWANHNPPNTHSAEDWRQGHAVLDRQLLPHAGVLPHRQPARRVHLVAARTCVMIWVEAPRRRSSTRCRRRWPKRPGYPGIYFVAMSDHDSPERTKDLFAKDTKAATTYHSFQLAWQRAQERSVPVRQPTRHVSRIVARGGKICPGPALHADRRHRLGCASLARREDDGGLRPHARTARQTLPAGRQYADETGKKIILLGPMNEWGEGSYIEPYAEYGFQDLDQVCERLSANRATGPPT